MPTRIRDQRKEGRKEKRFGETRANSVQVQRACAGQRRAVNRANDRLAEEGEARPSVDCAALVSSPNWVAARQLWSFGSAQKKRALRPWKRPDHFNVRRATSGWPGSKQGISISVGASGNSSSYNNTTGSLHANSKAAKN